MSDYVHFLGAITRCDGLLAFGKFIRDDGQIIDEMGMPLNAFNVPPPPATVIIARAKLNGPGPIAKLDLKFRAATLEEIQFFDRVEMAEVFQWMKTVEI
jgi:hypothetical protein